MLGIGFENGALKRTNTVSAARILIVEDDRELLASVVEYLEAAGFEARSAANAESALAAVEEYDPDLIILDIVLPEEFLVTGERADGLTVLKRLRKTSQVPVLMLSATALASLKVLALDLGADDYLTKPFDSRELMARVNAILRRGKAPQAQRAVWTFGKLRIEPDTRRVWKDGGEIELTPIEFGLLKTMAHRPGMLYTREQLLRSAWKDEHYGDERVVDTHISSLRKKIESNPMKPEFIITVRGAGYRFEGA